MRNRHFFVILLVCVVCTCNRLQFYITPSLNETCPQDSSCLTLSQLATNSSKYYGNASYLSLLFLPGSHTLTRELTISTRENMSMMKAATQLNGTVYIDCQTHPGRLVISETIFTSIKGLIFIACGGSRVTQVTELIIEDTIFQLVDGSGNALVLSEVAAASIIRSFFLFNINGNGNGGNQFMSDQEVCHYVFFEKQMTNSGALYIASSNVSISSSKFINNTAEIGSALVARNSNLSIVGSIYNYSHATIGGVMVTYESSVNIRDSTFTHNTAQEHSGVLLSYGGSFTISTTTFTNNSAFSVGVMGTYNKSSFTIISSTFAYNSAVAASGVMTASDEAAVAINNSIFTYNSASLGGVMSTLDVSSITVTGSIFTYNTAKSIGGVMSTRDKSSLSITYSNFANNNAGWDGYGGGVIFTSSGSPLSVMGCNFTNNIALFNAGGGVITTLTFHESSITIIRCHFFNNRAAYGGVIRTLLKSSFTIVNSTFNGNQATVSGGIIATLRDPSLFVIISCNFTNNSASYSGGVVNAGGQSSFNITHSLFNHNNARYGGGIGASGQSLLNMTSISFASNHASEFGGVIWCTGGSVNVEKSRFMFNSAESSGGVLFTTKCATHIGNSLFDNNFGSLYAFNSNLTFRGTSHFKRFREPLNARNVLTTHEEGGAITSFQSTVAFKGTVTFLYNQAWCGGAILAIESRILMYGEATIANNTALNDSGGGISLRQSHVEIKGYCFIFGNRAVRGGGIHATGSTVAIHHQGSLNISHNHAENGSGIYLEVNAKLYLLKTDRSSKMLLYLMNNHANFGGALYVADETNSATCLYDTECFIQTLALHQYEYLDIETENILLFGNSALMHGPDIFGGLLDRCIPSAFAEVYLKERAHYTGFTYLKNITSNIKLDSIASQPVRLCFCSEVGQADCSYHPSPIRVKKGETFKLSLVAVDQVNHSVNASIINYLKSSDGGFGEGQQSQRVEKGCTELTFNVVSPHESELLTLYADGPCANAKLSRSSLTIQFLPCTCPVGFEPSSKSKIFSRCECICNSRLLPYITNCNSMTGSLLRMNTNSWITYINDTEHTGFIIHPNCPFDYCHSQTENISINFNHPGGADTQCTYGREKVLCGACQQNLSLSLGSSRCLPCYSHWPAVLVVILVSGTIAGFLLVTALLTANITVAVGLINGFIFYANIVAANSAVFFPTSEPSFPSVFVSWLNLDIGFDVCFCKDLDTYSKTWLQLAFPAYIITLVVLIIIVSEYSPKFVRLIGKRDPIATLATLILLSYAKLLSITITALSPAVLQYPDGTQDIVWLPDGNVKYLQGKHISLFVMAVLIILIGLPYTTLIFLWQWLVQLPKWKVFKWTRNTKLNAFITTYHAPYDSRHRYWTGLLLLVRVLLYITASLTVSSKPQTSLLITALLVGGLLLLKLLIGLRVYRNSFTDILNTLMYFNLLLLTVLSLYDFKTDTAKQTAAAYTSTIIAFILLTGVIIYHVMSSITCRKDRTLQAEVQELKEYLLVPVTKAKVTESTIELPNPQSKMKDDNIMPKTIEVSTLPYQ